MTEKPSNGEDRPIMLGSSDVREVFGTLDGIPYSVYDKPPDWRREVFVTWWDGPADVDAVSRAAWAGKKWHADHMIVASHDGFTEAARLEADKFGVTLWGRDEVHECLTGGAVHPDECGPAPKRNDAWPPDVQESGK